MLHFPFPLHFTKLYFTVKTKIIILGKMVLVYEEEILKMIIL